MQRPRFIYALTDPETDNVRYVGQTVNPSDRYRRHIRFAKNNKHTRVARWIRGLINRDLQPGIKILETVIGDAWKEREQFWIAEFRNEGLPLTNLTDGGEGTIGYSPTIEWRENNGQIMKALWEDPQYRDLQSKSRSLPEGQWARNYEACTDCSRTDRRHAGDGLCEACYNKQRHRDQNQPDRPYFDWALDHERCVECGTTDRPHKGYGRCENCYARYRRSLKQPKPKRWSLKHRECVICHSTEQPHQGHGMCKRCHARERYRTSVN